MEFINKEYYEMNIFNRFIPYKHFNKRNLWLVLHFRDIYSDFRGKQSFNIVMNHYMVYEDNHLDAVLTAEKVYKRDKELSRNYEKKRDNLSSIFKRVRNMNTENIDEFNDICKPLIEHIKKRKKETNLVEDVNFYNFLMDMIRKFNFLLLDTRSKLLYKKNK